MGAGASTKVCISKSNTTELVESIRLTEEFQDLRIKFGSNMVIPSIPNITTVQSSNLDTSIMESCMRNKPNLPKLNIDTSIQCNMKPPRQEIIAEVGVSKHTLSIENYDVTPRTSYSSNLSYRSNDNSSSPIDKPESLKSCHHCIYCNVSFMTFEQYEDHNQYSKLHQINVLELEAMNQNIQSQFDLETTIDLSNSTNNSAIELHKRLSVSVLQH